MSIAHWRPRATRAVLAARAELLAELRRFFAEHDVLEVVPPLLSRNTVTAPAIESIEARAPGYDAQGVLYLQTSPEYAMKRLLASGSGPIYAITPAFRDGESGARHNPEFCLLEWYRPGYTLEQLMDEVERLVHRVLERTAATRISYREAVRRHVGLDPFDAETDALAAAASRYALVDAERLSRDELLDFLLSVVVEPRLGDGACFVHGFPGSQAALAELDPGPPPVARRFELFVDGLELANGYQELTDADEQRHRFEREREARRGNAQRVPDVDERLIAALEHGLPRTSGVALGVDRLLMLKLGLDDIRDTLAFPIDRA